jgi:DNA repair protein RAD16
MSMNNVSPKIQPKKHSGARAGTLVVCPLVALSQWKSEIEKFTEPGCLRVCVYHGPNRESEMNAELIRKYDVVLTTYQVLEQDFRKMVSPNKVTCPNCRGKFKIDKLRVHLTYFCGAAAQRTEAQARQRRGDDRNNNNNNNPKGSTGSSTQKGNASLKKFPTKKVTPKNTKIVKTFESASSDDNDDSGPTVTPPVIRRPKRVASKVASTKLKSSVNEWSPQGDDDDDDDEESCGSDFDSDQDSETSDDDDLISDSDDTPIQQHKKKSTPAKSIAIAKQKQAEALAKFQKGKKKDVAVKTKGSQKGKAKKEFDVDSDEGSTALVRDPMEGIDINALMEEAMAGSRFSFLHSFCWWRIVLDEAHFIKSRSSQTAAAAFALTSIHRWCLSGTPLQNRVGELYSLIRFLRIDPMAHYFCRHKSCTCKSIHYRMQQGRCLDCSHPSMMHFSHFNKYVLNPIQRDGYSGDGRRAMFLLRDSVLNLCLLRRTKQNRSADMNLPPRLVTIRPVRLHPVEEDFYEALYTQTKSSFNDYVAEGTLLNNYAHIFDLLTKMRQAVNHPYLIVHSKRSSTREAGQKAAAVAIGATDCALCHEPPTGSIVSTCCDGVFCRSCVIEYLSGALGEGTPCPSCSAPFSIDLNQASPVENVDDGTLSAPLTSYSGDVPSLKQMTHVQTGSILRRLNLAEFATSTKIEVLVQELIEMRRQRPGSKALVFSQFVNMLDLVRWRLHSDPCLADMGLGVCILHGGMDAKSRDAALKNFRENSNCRVLLLSLKAAGVALNLTVASECFLLDLWWNVSLIDSFVFIPFMQHLT